MEIRGQDRVLNALRRARSQGRLGHGLLFLGPAGVGKATVAARLARGLVCDAPGPEAPFGCGRCGPCRRADAGSHPDIFWVRSEAEAQDLGLSAPAGGKNPARAIVVSQIRELSRQLRMRPYEGRAQVAILSGADRMNDSAANALLKTLEEPRDGAFLILLAEQLRQLPPTIASRCQTVRFAPLPPDVIEQILTHEGLDHAAERAALAAGSLARARGLVITDEGEGARGRAELDVVLGGTTEERLHLVETVGRDREAGAGFLTDLERACRDALTARERALDRQSVYRLLDQIDIARDGLSRSAHVQMALEEVVLSVSR